MPGCQITLPHARTSVVALLKSASSAKMGAIGASKGSVIAVGAMVDLVCIGTLW